jgi:hypothetical protein
MKKLLNKIRKVINWLPIIWNDRDYDYYGIYVVLENKLKNMLVFFESDKPHQTYDTLNPTIKNIKLAIKLLEKIKEEYYGLEYMDYIEEDRILIPTGNNNTYRLDTKLKNDNLDEYFKKYHVKNIPTDFKERKNLARTISDSKQKQCKRLFFELLNNRIEYWWD